jgi:RHS repeat-associated protein
VAASDPDFIANPYLFTGRRFDIETGLYYYRARYYNPHIGRFMQTDPVGYSDGINWYLYCRNNPLNGTDPSGMVSSLATPQALSEVVLLYGIGDAISIYGRGAVIDWIIQTAGTSVAVSGMMVQLLPDPCDNNDPCAPLNSFERIIEDDELFRYWYRHKKPKSRRYDETEILKIIDKLEEMKIGGCGSGRADPPHKDGEDEWEWHFHPDPSYADNKKIAITEKAYELLKKLGF